MLGALPSPDGLDVHRARNDWLAECRWHAEPLRDTVTDIHVDVHQHDSRAALTLTGRGSWPTDGHLPMGALTERDGDRAWLWQIESPAGWRWDLGERDHGTYLALNGPTDAEHQWRIRLTPGSEFTTVPGVLALGRGLDDAFAALTSYRRAVRRPHPDHTTLPVVFNDYMNTLMGDPTTEKLLPLIDAAAAAGSEYFCIDSGWYDDSTEGWWDSVGEWLPSPRRFPDGGIRAVLDRIRERGMVPGLWLEPEVVGVRSPVAAELPRRPSSSGTAYASPNRAATSWTCGTRPPARTSTRRWTASSATGASDISSWTTTSWSTPEPARPGTSRREPASSATPRHTWTGCPRCWTGTRVW